MDVPSAAGDERGFALGSTDFNADGIRDLVIGQPGATVNFAEGPARTC